MFHIFTAVCKPYYTPGISCAAYFRRYQYVERSGDCQEFIYGGCGGNSNNFATLEDCRRKCAPEKLPTPSEPVVVDSMHIIDCYYLKLFFF